MSTTPILVLGAGRMGGAMVAGWLKAEAFPATALAIRDPHPGAEAQAAIAAGAEPDPQDLARFQTLVLAVKPQLWREAAAAVAPRLAPDAVIVSVVAGVLEADLQAAFGGRAVARIMPTTGVAVADGVASIHSSSAEARARAEALFAPIATVVHLPEEALLDGATAVSGSAPAYLYAFIEALEQAGEELGLAPEASRTLARATVASAAVLLRETGEEPAELRRQVTSPNGVTEAALRPLMAQGSGLPHLLRQATRAAVARSRELGATTTP